MPGLTLLQIMIRHTLMLLSLSRTIYAAYNVTVDNTNSLIVYQGAWGVLSLTGYDYGGSQELVDMNYSPDGAGSTATLNFTGFSRLLPPMSS